MKIILLKLLCILIVMAIAMWCIDDLFKFIGIMILIGLNNLTQTIPASRVYMSKKDVS